jgi:hypothetical protein
MDIEEFAKGAHPRKKRSKLIPFKEQILALDVQGYSYPQIRDWLALNNVTVSMQMVHKFIAQQKANLIKTSKQRELVSSENTKSIVTEFIEPANRPITQADKIRAKLEEQKRDAESKHFKHDKTGNL